MAGNNIRKLREARNWSMEELAKRCDPPTTASQINKLEKSQRQLKEDWITRLASAFGVQPFEISDSLGAMSDKEKILLEKYRALDERAREAFETWIDMVKK